MKWNDPWFSGTHDEWFWIDCRFQIDELPQLVSDHHGGNRLAIATFDSGSITPTPEERALGWSVVDEAMVSPPLTPRVKIPREDYDEWYIFPELPERVSILDRFVNHGGFTLADPTKLAASHNPPWHPSDCDWLVPLQMVFWENLTSINPITYVSSGDWNIVVTKLQPFAQSVTQVAHRTAE